MWCTFSTHQFCTRYNSKYDENTFMDSWSNVLFRDLKIFLVIFIDLRKKPRKFGKITISAAKTKRQQLIMRHDKSTWFREKKKRFFFKFSHAFANEIVLTRFISFIIDNDCFFFFYNVRLLFQKTISQFGTTSKTSKCHAI